MTQIRAIADRHPVRPLADGLRRSPAALVGVCLTAALAAVAVLDERVASGYVFATSGERLEPPSADHLMGTDQLGRDVLTAVVRGAHTSLSVVLGVVAISAVVGVLVGALSGLRGGVLDDVVMRLVETVQTVPRFFLAVLVVGWFGPEGATLTILLGLTSWPLLARVVRAETLSLREREFVEAARSGGASDLRVLVRHVVPNVASATLVVLALIGSRVVLLEAGLAFLGLADPNVMSWGTLINNAQPYLEQAWWLSVFPGGAIAIAVLGMNLLADGLNDLLDPSHAPAGTRAVGAVAAHPGAD
jgi:peptide/nickel transport system permease protein